MRCHKPNTDQHAEMVVLANGAPCAEFAIPGANGANLSDGSTIECFVAVAAGDTLTLEGSFEGSVRHASFDVLADGAFVSDKRLVCRGGAPLEERSLRFDKVFDAGGGDAAGIVVVEGDLRVQTLAPEDIEAVSSRQQPGERHGLGALCVVVSLAQEFDGEREAGYAGASLGGWRQRAATGAAGPDDRIPPTLELALQCTDDQVRPDRQARHLRHLRQARPGTRPWARFVFHYRTQDAIDGSGCERLPGSSVALEPGPESELVSGSATSLPLRDQARVARERSLMALRNAALEPLATVEESDSLFMTPPPPSPRASRSESRSLQSGTRPSTPRAALPMAPKVREPAARPRPAHEVDLRKAMWARRERSEFESKAGGVTRSQTPIVKQSPRKLVKKPTVFDRAEDDMLATFGDIGGRPSQSYRRARTVQQSSGDEASFTDTRYSAGPMDVSGHPTSSSIQMRADTRYSAGPMDVSGDSSSSNVRVPAKRKLMLSPKSSSAILRGISRPGDDIETTEAPEVTPPASKRSRTSRRSSSISEHIRASSNNRLAASQKTYDSNDTPSLTAQIHAAVPEHGIPGIELSNQFLHVGAMKFSRLIYKLTYNVDGIYFLRTRAPSAARFSPGLVEARLDDEYPSQHAQRSRRQSSPLRTLAHSHNDPEPGVVSETSSRRRATPRGARANAVASIGRAGSLHPLQYTVDEPAPSTEDTNAMAVETSPGNELALLLARKARLREEVESKRREVEERRRVLAERRNVAELQRERDELDEEMEEMGG